MTISSTSLAAANAASINNVPFGTEAAVLNRKMVIAATYDPAILTIVDDVPVQVFSAEEVGDTYGFGFPLHRMAVQAFAGGLGLPVWVIPQSEDGAAVQATGTITMVGTITTAGTFHLYIDGIYVPVEFALADDATAMALAIKAAVTANTDLPVTADNVAGVLTFTAKPGGTYGNDISITLNWGIGEASPAGVTSSVIVAMASGATDPDIDDALNGMGTGDLKNQDWFTDGVVGYAKDVAATLNKISAYVGAGNLKTGTYSENVARPIRFLWADTGTGSAALAALIVISDARLTDRSEGEIGAPGAPRNPYEIAAFVAASAARINQTRAEEHYLGVTLPFLPGDKGDMWTSEYANRDAAVKAGISTTRLNESGVLQVEDIVTFYRPASIPVASNVYRSYRNISIIQNVLNAVKVEFAKEKWQGVSIVADVSKVTNATDKAKARDIGSVKDTLFQLLDSMESQAWIYSAANAKAALNEAGAIVVRSGGRGFDVTLKIQPSGEATIFNNEIQMDTSLSVSLAA